MKSKFMNLIILGLFIFTNGCKKNDFNTESIENATLSIAENQLNSLIISSIPTQEINTPIYPPQNNGEQSEFINSTSSIPMICSSQPQHALKKDDTMILLGNDNPIVGVTYDFKDLETHAEFTARLGEYRAPITLYTDGVGPISSVNVDSPNEAALIEGVQKIIGAMEDRQPGGGLVTVSEVYSTQHLYLEMDLSLEIGFINNFNLDAAFSEVSDNETNVFLVEILETDFTLSVNESTFPSEYFIDTPPYDFSEPLAIVTDVTYGVAAYLIVKTTYDKSKVEASLEAAYNGFFVDGSASLSTEYSKVIESSEIRAFTLGGSASNLFLVNDVNSLHSFMTNDIPRFRSVPLSAKIKFLDGTPIVNWNYAEFNKVDCNIDVEPTIINLSDEVLEVCADQLIGGDSNLGETPVDAELNLRLIISEDSTSLILKSYFDVVEPDDDETHGFGQKEFELYKTNKKILAIVSPTTFDFNYRDNDNSTDGFTYGPDSLITAMSINVNNDHIGECGGDKINFSELYLNNIEIIEY